MPLARRLHSRRHSALHPRAHPQKAARIDAPTTDAFLLENHLWGATKARYRYGLFRHNELVAVATFSARWKMRRHGEVRASHELIRYCSRQGLTVVGGISKLIAAFRRDASPDECVTVIDRDWGDGSGWASLGFRPLRRLPPVTFFVGPDGRRCHPGSGPNPHRRRLPESLSMAVEQRSQTLRASSGVSEEEISDQVERLLATHSYFAVHDAGAERHLLVLNEYSAASPAAIHPAPRDLISGAADGVEQCQ